MRLLQSLSVGFVLACLCATAEATPDSLLNQYVWNYSNTTHVVLPRVYEVAKDTMSRNMKLVYDIAARTGYPEVLQGILLQETAGGLARSLVGSPHAHVNQRSYGLMQVQPMSARVVLRDNPDLLARYYPGKQIRAVSNVDLIKLLMTDSAANITIAMYLYEMYFKMLGFDHDRTIAAYNVGIGGVQKIKAPARFKYVVEVKQKIQSVVNPFNEKYTLRTTEQHTNSVVLVHNT